eukprot:gnl/Trimastix_PCT/1305.p2 GENE.gnl/Trimastix_PCT/1305~~gnl/Trimastix_PCT/1305.p2  ORF type:complete len:302 (+),score=109.77 gnl/Trimastix_PCT/1305:49-954(+)
MKRTTQLRQLIESGELNFIMEAHNGLSARIAEEAGFKGIWASGLTISAQLGLRDANEASWSQVLDVVEYMADATSLPILIDGDTGYGNFNNARRMVTKLEQRGVAGICVEDKIFPKMNSFVAREQTLASVDEFCLKIRAMKETQRDPDFVVVARTEAFIVGLGLEEAMRRAEAYRAAGADAILVHSKRKDAQDIEAFVQAWGNRHPVVIVPTTYGPSTPTQRFRELGINLIIWANHALRASIRAMQQMTQAIHDTQSIAHVSEENAAPVAEVFRLQNLPELLEAEKRFLPSSAPAAPVAAQ